MTKTEIILTLVAVIAVVFSIITAIFAARKNLKLKAQVEYYQHPETQKSIARHVIQNRWYSESEEVFK